MHLIASNKKTLPVSQEFKIFISYLTKLNVDNIIYFLVYYFSPLPLHLENLVTLFL